MDMTSVYQIIAAFVGTVAFSLLFHVPERQCAACGAVGAIGWIFYLLIHGFSETLACLVASIVVVVLARILAVLRKVPSNVFMLPGLFPVLPGIGLYNTIYHMMTGDWIKGVGMGLNTLEQIGAMVLGIILVFSVPNRVFAKVGKLNEKARTK